MTPWTKTLAMIGAAGAMTALVFITRPSASEPQLISDQGQALAPDLKDPLAVKSLEVISYDADAAKMRAFKVAFDGKRWIVPSHSGYPADAADKVSAAASAFAGLIKERVVSDNKADHAGLGVLEPTEENLATGSSGVGVRVTLNDASGRPLADVIIGKALKTESTSPFEQPSGKRYVREPGKNRVYVTSLNTGFSTRFVDWVETDLLKTTADQIGSVIIDRYQIDAERGVMKEPLTIALNKFTPSAPPTPKDAPPPAPPPPFWTVKTEPGGAPEAQVLNMAPLNDAIGTLTGLKIVGVRPKPANLAKALGGAAAEVKLTLTDQLSLQSRGFYLGPTARLLANEGQMAVKCTDGVVYNLWFGEVVPDSEDAASGGQVGQAPTATADAASAANENKPRGPSNARYMMITVNFDPALAPEPARSAELVEAEANLARAKAEHLAKYGDGKTDAPKPEPKPADKPAEGEAQPPAGSEPPTTPPTDPDTTPPTAPPAPTESDALKALRAQHQGAVDVWKQRVESGKKRAESLSKRFADWYYVISADSLSKLRPGRDDLLKAEEPKAGPGGPSASPDGLGPVTLPPPAGE